MAMLSDTSPAGALTRAVGAVAQRVQGQAGHALRSRVAGQDAQTAAERIWGAPGERRFTERDPVWRVHSDAAMFPGGVAALLLQSLHPQAMAGVAGHSGYKGDPWGRLQRTSHFLATTTFGTVPDAQAAVDRVREIHERVRGKDDRGEPYRASDPHLLRWVHCAEAWSFLQGYQRFSSTPLTPREEDLYVAQAAEVAEQLGADAVPTTRLQLAQALEAYRPELRATPAARDTARFLMLTPPLGVAARAGYYPIMVGGLSLLPEWARAELRLPTGRVATAAMTQMGRVAVHSVQWAMRGIDDASRREALDRRDEKGMT